MAARKKAANVRTVKVRDMEIHIDEAYANSWEAFMLLREFKSAESDELAKFDLSMKLIETATGITEADIVEAAGGVKAPAIDVIKLAVDIVQAIAPKN